VERGKGKKGKYGPGCNCNINDFAGIGNAVGGETRIARTIGRREEQKRKRKDKKRHQLCAEGFPIKARVAYGAGSQQAPIE